MFSSRERQDIPRACVATLNEAPPGQVILRYLGIVRGITVRSRSRLITCCANIKQFFGGRIRALKNGCEEARLEAYNLMIKEAHDLGANGVLGVRYEQCEVEPGATEVLAYGTAVQLAASR